MHGHFSYDFEYPLEYQVQNLLLYYDEKHQWPAVYKKPKTCQQKESVLNPNNGQIVNLTDWHYSSECLKHRIGEGKMFYKCVAQRRFRSVRERWWYIAISNCNSTKGLMLNYTLRMYNSNDDYWYRHFSADEFYILQTDITALTIYALLFIACCFEAYILYSRSYLHATYKMYMVSVFCQLLSLIFLVAYYALYAEDGIGMPLLKLLGLVFSSVSTLIFLLLLILIAKGYTVTRGRLKPITSAKIGTFMTLYVIVYSALFTYEQQYFDPAEVLYLYESPAGYGIVGLRLVGWGWFVYATVFTLLHYPEKASFYTRLFLLYTIWFLSAPLIILIAAFVVPKWMREKVINIVELLVILFAHGVFFALTRPSKANKNFPFHVRTTQVDVEHHPTIGVIADNYIDQFPHHAYEPTQSVVPEGTVNYEALFGGSNNNTLELKYSQPLSVTHMQSQWNNIEGPTLEALPEDEPRESPKLVAPEPDLDEKGGESSLSPVKGS
ncbi:transmembrane protein 145-like [Ornithodoros turicata]